MSSHPVAPAWSTTQWFNSSPLSLEVLAGRPVALFAFQMLCPGCVTHCLPQAKRLAALFAGTDLAVVGLHTVFEHHDAMTPVALKAFLHEYRIGFPVGVDEPGRPGPIPVTMERYGMRGTPTAILIDRAGRLREQAFGAVDDLLLGAAVARLIDERVSPG
ncbi:MAG: redoxin domain-containing protein [Gemmatimonadetes bacterium]|nr:redoxin domain-containing protein [Gemmatimonadota bacterium]